MLVKNSLQSHHLTTHHTPHTTHHTPHTLVCFIALPDSGERMHQVVEGRLHRSATLSGSDCTVGCSQPKLDFSLRQEDKLKVLKRAAGNNSVLHHSVLDWRDSPASCDLSYELPSPVLRNSQSCCDGSTPSHRSRQQSAGSTPSQHDLDRDHSQPAMAPKGLKLGSKIWVKDQARCPLPASLRLAADPARPCAAQDTKNPDVFVMAELKGLVGGHISVRRSLVAQRVHTA